MKPRAVSLSMLLILSSIFGTIGCWNRAANGATSVDLGGGQTMQFVSIPEGSFTMGSPITEISHHSDEGPQHQVRISALQMQTTEVTQGQYMQIVGNNPSYFNATQIAYSSGYTDTSSQPVEQVSWYDAVEFCNKVSDVAGVTHAYTIDKTATDPNNLNSYDHVKWLVTCDFTSTGFRLPTEAEWEYACRAGSTGMFYWGDSDDEAKMKSNAWYDRNAYYQTWTLPHAEKGGTQKVGQKLPNAWGLYDMSGNVWEWCWDWYGSLYFSNSPGIDPKGECSGQYRIVRGGHGAAPWNLCRSAYRYYNYPYDRHGVFGFRLVRFFQAQ
ncbi:MAG: formylglycine-generating enzyme family protein [Candidatus Riflebacteria bacterium]|nr:formylglycine-generating enzyme family protein [Candidatus Riflebacteria bacterium]